jgi:glycosyltransferase involved in cell wall biosynthesis
MTDRLRILLFSHVPRDPNAGASRVYHFLSEELTRQGHHVNLYHFDDLELPARLTLPIQRLAFPQAIARFLRRLPLDSYDVIQVSHRGGALFSSLRQRPRRSLLVNHSHGFYYYVHESAVLENLRGHLSLSLKYRLVTSRMEIAWDRSAIRASDVNIVQNSRDRELILDRGYASPDRIRDVALPVHSALRPPDGWRREHRPAGTRLLWLGSWVERKGNHYMVQAFEDLIRLDKRFRLVVAGVGNRVEEILAAFSKTARACVEVIPRTDPVSQSALLDSSDIYVFPSLAEGYGFSVIEAMARGLPCIATPAGVVADRFEHDRHLSVVPAASASMLASAIFRLSQDPDRRIRLGAAGMAEVGKLTLESFGEQMVSIYDEGLARLRASRADMVRTAVAVGRT